MQLSNDGTHLRSVVTVELHGAGSCAACALALARHQSPSPRPHPCMCTDGIPDAARWPTTPSRVRYAAARTNPSGSRRLRPPRGSPACDQGQDRRGGAGTWRMCGEPMRIKPHQPALAKLILVHSAMTPTLDGFVAAMTTLDYTSPNPDGTPPLRIPHSRVHPTEPPHTTV